MFSGWVSLVQRLWHQTTFQYCIVVFAGNELQQAYMTSLTILWQDYTKAFLRHLSGFSVQPVDWCMPRLVGYWFLFLCLLRQADMQSASYLNILHEVLSQWFGNLLRAWNRTTSDSWTCPKKGLQFFNSLGTIHPGDCLYLESSLSPSGLKW